MNEYNKDWLVDWLYTTTILYHATEIKVAKTINVTYVWLVMGSLDILLTVTACGI